MDGGPNLSIEVPQENLVYEITYDGHEIPQAPLTMSDNLSKLASRIDWSSESDCAALDVDATTAPAAVDADAAGDSTALSHDSSSDSEQTSVWPWQSVRDKVRCAYTEACVLSDILSIARHKRYMVLDAVTQDAPEPRLLVQVISKKKALMAASNILSAGADRMRENLACQKRSRSAGDFYTELMRVRQSWRLRKVANAIVGDLSYKQVGSRFWLPGTFEVRKSDERADEDLPTPAAKTLSEQGGAVQSPLTVNIPNELRGAAYIYVIIKYTVAGREQVDSARSSLLSSCVDASPVPGPAPVQPRSHWRPQLEAAQNVLFCRELIAQLAREAVQMGASECAHLVVGDTITSQVFPDVQLLIGLMHSQPAQSSTLARDDSDEANSSHTNATAAAAAGSCGHNNYVLEHSLHQLLRELHYNNMNRSTPHPATAQLGPCKRRRMAGPGAMSRAHLLKLVDSETILERIVRQARHYVLRLRAAATLDECARDVRDPLIVAHWGSINSPNQSCCKVNIVTHGYDSVHRTTFVVNVLERELRCVCRDGRVLTVGADAAQLYHTVMTQVCLHNMLSCQAMARIVGWSVSSGCNWLLPQLPQLSPAADDDVDTCSSCVLVSPGGEHTMLVRCWPSAERPINVFVSSVDCATTEADVSPAATPTDELLAHDKWRHLGQPFKQVHWDLIEGRNLLNKLELLLASLSNTPSSLVL